MLPPPCLTVGMVFRGLNASPFLHQIILVVLCPNSSIFVSSDQSTLFHWARESSICTRANFSCTTRCFLDLSGTLCGQCAATPMLLSASVTADFEMQTPTVAKSSLMVYRVAAGLTFAVTPTFAAALPCNLCGCPFWGTFTFVLRAFQHVTTPLTVERGTPKVVERLPYLFRLRKCLMMASLRSVESSLRGGIVADLGGGLTVLITVSTVRLCSSTLLSASLSTFYLSLMDVQRAQ